MRVEVRQRPATGESSAGLPPPKRSASARADLVFEAYSDSCFESPTRFYIASAEHPKLGKWAQPSTLRYHRPPPQLDYVTAQCLDEAMLFASSQGGGGRSNKSRSSTKQRSNGRPRTTGEKRSTRAVGCGSCNPSTRSGNPPLTSTATSSSPGARSSMSLGNNHLAEPGRGKRPISPVGALGTATSSSCSIRGQREAPRISTPVSGRVAPLHQRSFQTSTLPASSTLCGSFDRQYHPPRAAFAGSDVPTRPSTIEWSTATSGDRGVSNEAPSELSDAGGMEFEGAASAEQGRGPGAAGVREAGRDGRGGAQGGGHGEGEGGRGERGGPAIGGGGGGGRYRSTLDEEDQSDEPDIRYRVTALPGIDGEGAHLPQMETDPPAFVLSSEQRRGIGGDGVTGDGDDKDSWVASQVDPFMSALRQALLQDKPADVPAYASDFSTKWRRAKERSAE